MSKIGGHRFGVARINQDPSNVRMVCISMPFLLKLASVSNIPCRYLECHAVENVTIYFAFRVLALGFKGY